MIDFEFMVLKFLMFKVCGIIRISKIEFFNFCGIERVNSCTKMMDFFFSKVSGYNLIKNGLHQRLFPMKFVKLFRTDFNESNFW